MAKTRINLNLDCEILKNVDDEAKKLGVSRTAFISMIIGQYIRQNKTIDTASNMVEVMNKLQGQEELKLFEK